MKDQVMQLFECLDIGVVPTGSPSTVALTDGKQEFCTTVEIISAAGQVIPTFIIWSNKVHTTGIYGKGGVHTEHATFAISPK